MKLLRPIGCLILTLLTADSIHAQSGEPVEKITAGVEVRVFVTANRMLEIGQEGRTRIDAAKDALSELVRDSLPVGCPLALRVLYGDDSELVVPHRRATRFPIAFNRRSSMPTLT